MYIYIDLLILKRIIYGSLLLRSGSGPELFVRVDPYAEFRFHSFLFLVRYCLQNKIIGGLFPVQQ